MAQTSSATREPSMEEILASIRRIIEDSDVTKQATAELTSAPQPENRVESSKAEQAAEVEKRGEVAQFPRQVSTEAVQDDARPIVPAFTLDAALRGSLSAQPSSGLNSEPTRAEIHERNVAHVRIATVNPPVPPVVVAADELPKPDAIKASEALLMHVAEKRVVSITPPTAKEEVVPVSETTSENVSAKTYDKPLISQAAEEQVSASFGSLSQALIEEQKRLLNEKMEALLRPMLQEWLDTNLPPLVERLVREEIERVVRRG